MCTGRLRCLNVLYLMQDQVPLLNLKMFSSDEEGEVSVNAFRCLRDLFRTSQSSKCFLADSKLAGAAVVP